MATIYGTQIALNRTGREMQPNYHWGKCRIAAWDHTLAAQAAINDVVVVGKLPARARVIFGREFHSAMTTGGAAATGQLGSYAVASDGITLGAVVDDDKWQAAVTYDAAGNNDIANTLATFALDEETQDVFIAYKVTVEAFAAAGRLAGFLVYV